MTEELDTRIAQFWSWFVATEPELRATFEAAIATKDYPTMQGVVERLGTESAKIGPHISLRLNGGKGMFTLAIQSPEPSAAESVTRLLATAPSLAAWKFVDRIESPAQNVIVRDEEGNELTVPYADVRFVMLPPKEDGSTSVMFGLDRDFDPRGEKGHLYQSVAREMIKNAFGATPPGMGSFALVPMSWLDRDATAPVSELAQRWRDRPQT